MHHLRCRHRRQRDRPAKRATGSFQAVKPLAVRTGHKVTGAADHQQATRKGNVEITRLDPGNVDPHRERVPRLEQVQRRPRDRAGSSGRRRPRPTRWRCQPGPSAPASAHPRDVSSHRERVDPKHPHRVRARPGPPSANQRSECCRPAATLREQGEHGRPSRLSVVVGADTSRLPVPSKNPLVDLSAAGLVAAPASWQRDDRGDTHPACTHLQRPPGQR
jgi:hypothetical protein